MNPTIYTAKTAWGETIRFRADLEQASAPIQVEGEDGVWVTTPYQTADARHRESEARKLVLGWVRAE